MDRLQAKVIARIAYKEIQAVMEKWESQYRSGNDLCISFNWDGCISVDVHFFSERELIIEEKTDER